MKPLFLLVWLFHAILFVLFAPVLAADEAEPEIPILHVGEIYPLKVHKGYPAVFLSSYEGAYRGYNNQLRELVEDEENGELYWRLFSHTLRTTPAEDGSFYLAESLYREVQFRQQVNGSWSAWENIEPSGHTNISGSSVATVYRNPSLTHTIESTPVWIEGDAVEVRHRSNGLLRSQAMGLTPEDTDYSNEISDWITFEIEVLSDGYETWLDPYNRSEISRAYFRDYTAVEYTPVGWERPDYRFLPSMNDETAEWHFPDPEPGFAHLESQPTDAFRDATFQQLNFYRRLAGVPPSHRAPAHYEAEAQQGAVAQHLTGTNGAHGMFNPNFWVGDLHVWPLDSPWRQYFTNNGMDIWWLQTKSLLSNRGTAEAEPDWWHPNDLPGNTIRRLVDDLGASNHPVGHRQALLNPTAFEFAYGRTSATIFSAEEAPYWDERAFYDTTGTFYYPGNMNRDRWRAHPESIEMQRDNGIYFPAPGYVPYQVMPNRFSGQTVHLDGEFAGEDPSIIAFRATTDSSGFRGHEEITARVWWNGIEMDAYMGHATYYPLQHVLRDFAITVLDVLNPVDGEPTINGLLKEEDPDYFDGHWGVLTWSGRTWYPRPRNGTDVWEVEIYLSPTAEQQEEYNLPESTLLHSYSFEAYIPHIAFEDDTYMQGDSVFSYTMGWYNADNAPWLWLEDQKTWVYTLSTEEAPSSWFWDLELGWCYAGPQGWIWSRDLGTWLFHWPNPDLEKRALMRADNGEWIRGQ